MTASRVKRWKNERSEHALGAARMDQEIESAERIALLGPGLGFLCIPLTQSYLWPR